LAPLSRLNLAAVDNGGPLAKSLVDVALLGTSELQSLDDLHRLQVSDLAEDDVAAIEPRSDDGGDEELGAVAVWKETKSV
jgi:hypothetical protein